MRRLAAITLALTALCSSASAGALPQSAEDRARMFASCTGRLSATMEHQWLMSDPDAERTQAMRSYFVMLLETSQADSGLEPRDILNIRVETKLAHARLLTRATFSLDEREARTATRMATRYLNTCRSVLLS